jgi:serine/threonine protein kinase
MELCSGGRLLDEIAREGKFSEQRATIVIKDLMTVFKYCHEMGVHQDIKPENILLTKAGKTRSWTLDSLRESPMVNFLLAFALKLRRMGWVSCDHTVMDSSENG